ncbi:MAG: PEP-CTERM sorting domain-containing protein [bacterium]
MKKMKGVLTACLLFFLLLINASYCYIMTFDNMPSGWDSYDHPPEWRYEEYGLTLSYNAWWNGYGGGHLFMQGYAGNDYLIFDTPKYLKQFEINGLPTPGYQDSRHTFGPMNIAAFDNNNNEVWSGTADLTNYTDWNTWLTVSVETDNVSKLIFYAPWGTANPWNPMYDLPPSDGGLPVPAGSYVYWPSVDNMNVEDSNTQVPEPGTMLLLGSLATGLFGFGGLKKRFLK